VKVTLYPPDLCFDVWPWLLSSPYTVETCGPSVAHPDLPVSVTVLLPDHA
jgi:hypothetical protein